MNRINILLIGETESDKCAFSEGLKQYASSYGNVRDDPNTTGVRKYTIETNFPKFGVFKPKPRSYLSSRDIHLPIFHEKIINGSRESYEEAIDMSRGYEMREIERDDQISEFTVIDAPGFQIENEERIARIFSKLQQDIPIGLVLVMVPSGPLTPSQVSALGGYIDMFPELTNVLTFVHQVDYKELHPDKQLSQSLESKEQTLNKSMGGKTFPHFVIDYDLMATTPIRKCITYNTIHKILWLARKNIPITILSSNLIKKTPKMIDIDTIVSMRSRSIFTTTEETLQFIGEDEDELGILRSIYKFETSIAGLDAEIQINQDLLQYYNTDDLELLYEERFHDEHQVLPASSTRECITSKLGYPIDEIVRWSNFFTIESQDVAPIGEQAYRCICTKTDSDWSGFYHIKLYVKRRNRYKNEIEDLTQLLKLQREKMGILQDEKDKHLSEFQTECDRIRPLIDKHRQQIQLIQLTSATILNSAIFRELLEKKAYVGTASICSRNAEDIYMDWIRKSNEPLPSNPRRDSSPPTQSEAESHAHRITSPLQDNIKVEVISQKAISHSKSRSGLETVREEPIGVLRKSFSSSTIRPETAAEKPTASHHRSPSSNFKPQWMKRGMRQRSSSSTPSPQGKNIQGSVSVPSLIAKIRSYSISDSR